jgi:hypothetical protein
MAGVDAAGVDAGGVDAGGVDAGGVDAGGVDPPAGACPTSPRARGAAQVIVRSLCAWQVMYLIAVALSIFFGPEVSTSVAVILIFSPAVMGAAGVVLIAVVNRSFPPLPACCTEPVPMSAPPFAAATVVVRFSACPGLVAFTVPLAKQMCWSTRHLRPSRTSPTAADAGGAGTTNPALLRGSAAAMAPIRQRKITGDRFVGYSE